jgi:DNA-binding NarL/FixJ family response regulator
VRCGQFRSDAAPRIRDYAVKTNRREDGSEQTEEAREQRHETVAGQAVANQALKRADVYGHLRVLAREDASHLILDLFRRQAECGTLVHPTITQRLMDHRDRLQCDFPSMETPDALTAREIEILRLVARGYSNREMADALAIAEGTVKNYISSVLSKMGVRDRTRAVFKALETGCL